MDAGEAIKKIAEVIADYRSGNEDREYQFSADVVEAVENIVDSVR